MHPDRHDEAKSNHAQLKEKNLSSLLRVIAPLSNYLVSFETAICQYYHIGHQNLDALYSNVIFPNKKGGKTRIHIYNGRRVDL